MKNKTIHYYSLTPSETLVQLDSNEEGLTNAEAERRLIAFGSNIIPEPPSPGIFQVYLRQFKNHFIYILIAAAIISFLIQHLTDGIFITIVVFLNAVIGTFEEWKAETSAKALKKLVVKRAKALRNKHREEIPAQNLVPGDIIYFESGDSIPADARLLKSHDVRVDESLLTGESLPVKKSFEATVEASSAIHNRINMVYAGTHILRGRGHAIVTQTGARSEMGKIATTLSLKSETPPPIVTKLKKFTQQIALLTLFAVVFIALFQLLRGEDFIETLLTAVALMVSAIPEGLPIAITVTLSIASYLMSKHNVIIRSLPAVEGLGACTLIASDKTGTLTCNELTIKNIYLPPDKHFSIEGQGHTPKGRIASKNNHLPTPHEMKRLKDLAIAGMLCNEGLFYKDGGDYINQGDKVDISFLVFGEKLALNRDTLLNSYPEVYAIPYEPERRMAVSFHKTDQGYVVFVKGGIEKVFDLCKDHKHKQTWVNEATQMAQKGLRLIALAKAKIKDIPDSKLDLEDQVRELPKMDFLGIAGIADPIREEVPEAIKRCKQAGIKPIMITGDHPETAFSVAHQLGLTKSKKEVMTGDELKQLQKDRKKYIEAIIKTNVFARVEPETKLDIVEAEQEIGHFVAVTGDGVNDSPALRAANIGVAMGKSGTDIARSIADIILIDDSFASIVRGIFQGRVAYSNIRKVIYLLLSTGVAEIILFFLSQFANLPLPLFATQLLWLNLVSQGIQHVALAVEKAEEDFLKHPPRSPKEPIFDKLLIQQTILSGAVMGVVSLLFFWVALSTGWSEFSARNGLLLLLVMFENVHLFNCRSEKVSIFQMSFFSNKFLLISVLAAHGVHIFAMYNPWLQEILKVQPISLKEWLLLLSLSSTVIITMEIYKFVRRRGTK